MRPPLLRSLEVGAYRAWLARLLTSSRGPSRRRTAASTAPRAPSHAAPLPGRSPAARHEQPSSRVWRSRAPEEEELLLDEVEPPPAPPAPELLVWVDEVPPLVRPSWCCSISLTCLCAHAYGNAWPVVATEGGNVGLIDNMRRLSEQVSKRLPNAKNEEATKNALILPFLGALGYDIFDPTEVQPEYTADFAKKRSGGQAEKVDYAIHLNSVPAMFFECKSAEADPSQHTGQLARYFNATSSVKVAVVTNGVRYLFYTDLEEQNMMSDRPFFEFNILGFTERDAETLEAFTRANFDAGTVRTRAEDIIFTGKVTTYVNDLLRNPTEAFTRFLLGELDITTGKLTAKRVEKFVPIVRKAIQSTLLDMATRSIKQETQDPPPPAPASTAASAVAPPRVSAPAPVIATSEPVAEHGKGIVTTQEELDAFEIVRRICADSAMASKYPIQFRDAVNYFGINIGNSKKWFARLFFDGRRKAIVTRVPHERAALLAPGFEVEAPPESVGRSRVYISGPKDLDRLRPLVLLAYEEEVRRAESGAGEDEDAAGPAA